MAQELLGKFIVRNLRDKKIIGRVVETEAYLGAKDPASHACKGQTKRNSVMFGEPGVAYVYFCYGSHFMLNIVTEKEGVAGAVLLRGAEPVSGFSGKTANGPGKLTKAFKIGKKANRIRLCPKNWIYFAEDGCDNFKIVKTGRIGIKKGQTLPLRYYIEGNEHVSKLEGKR